MADIRAEILQHVRPRGDTDGFHYLLSSWLKGSGTTSMGAVRAFQEHDIFETVLDTLPKNKAARKLGVKESDVAARGSMGATEPRYRAHSHPPPRSWLRAVGE